MAEKPRLILHIGMHKTGTSTIQFLLNARRDALLDQGFCYARTDRGPMPDQPKHNSLTEALLGTTHEWVKEKRILLSEFAASGCHSLVLSAEGLSGPRLWSPSSLARIGELGAGMQIEAICYLRRQDTWVESLWNQRCKSGRCNVQIAEYIQDRKIRRHMGYLPMVRAWQSVAKLTVLGFETAAENGLIASFVAATGVSLREEARRNSSPSMATAAALAALARQGMPVSDWRALAALMPAEANRRALGARLRQELLASFAQENALLARDFGVRFPADMPDEPAEPLSAPDPAHLQELALRLAASAAPDAAAPGRPRRAHGPAKPARPPGQPRPGAAEAAQRREAEAVAMEIAYRPPAPAQDPPPEAAEYD